MKFVKYLAIAFAGVLMASCDEDFNDWASPIKNPEEKAITIPGYTATAAEGAVIDMANAPATELGFDFDDTFSVSILSVLSS